MVRVGTAGPNPRRCCAPALPRHGLNHRQRLRPWLVAHNLQDSGLGAAGAKLRASVWCRPCLSPLHRHPPATARLMAAPSSACAEQAATWPRARALKACLVQALNITASNYPHCCAVSVLAHRIIPVMCKCLPGHASPRPARRVCRQGLALRCSFPLPATPPPVRPRRGLPEKAFHDRQHSVG